MACTNDEKIYNPQVVSVTVPGITPPPTTSPILTKVTTITLTWPYVAPTNTLVLRAPELRNNHMTHLTREKSLSRGGSLIVFRDETWAKYVLHKLVFSAIEKAKADLFETFLNESLGKEIGYLDYESRQWRGYILNPNDSKAQEIADCGYSFKLDFRGKLA